MLVLGLSWSSKNTNVGFSDNKLISDILLYPNPTNDFIYFNTENKFDKIKVIDEKGKEIAILEIQNGMIDLRKFNKGTYFLQNFCDDLNNETWKIIKVE